MLRSTYKPSANTAVPTPLLPGWTEHDAPNGHKYYYNAETKQSTYTRPSAPDVTAAQGPVPGAASTSFFQYQTIPQLSDPNVANAYLAQYNAQNQPPAQRGGFSHGGRGGRDGRPRPEPIDKPKSKAPIPGCEPWILVDTKYGRRFVYNPEKNASYWRIPDKLKAGILELDQARIREKAGIKSAPAEEKGKDSTPTAQPRPQQEAPAISTYDDNDDSSEYEEVEVTDDEAEGEDGEDGHTSKPPSHGEAYGLDPGEYDDGNMDEWPEGAEGVEFSQEDAAALFRDLLDDFNINPYSTWEKLIEDGHIIEDPRYTLLNTMKARKETWQEWSKDKIRELKELRAKEEKKDPGYPT
ncbi:DNA replication protein 4 [Colletotrichum tofieldiae]|nr:DNA replication protein 4 [Colletotrichum tofieldiae]